MSVHKVTLKWSSKFSFHDLLKMDEKSRKQYEKHGVYLWLRPENKVTGNKVIAYVGKATDLWWRQFDHYRNQVGGLYFIPEGFWKEDRIWVSGFGDKLRVPGAESMRFLQEDFLKVATDKEAFQELISCAYDLAGSFQVYLAPVEEKGQEAILERNLLYDLQPSDTSWGTRTVPFSRLDIVHVNAEWLEETGISEFLHNKNRSVVALPAGHRIEMIPEAAG